MFSQIKKRDGRIVNFSKEKISRAIFMAAREVGGSDFAMADSIADKVINYMASVLPQDEIPTVEFVQDCVEKVLIEDGHAKTAKAYILYRAKRTRYREAKTELMDIVREILVETSRENANIGNSPSAKMLQIASAASKQYYLSNVIPAHIAKAHVNCDIHIHDLDFYGKTLNCLQIDLTKLLLNGFNTGYGYIRPPKRISSATAQAAIILQSNQNDMYGGQSFPHFDKSMAEVIRNLKEKPSYEEIFQAMEALIYNLNSMHSRAGAQVPFSSINLGTDTTEEGRLVIRAVLEVFDKGLGKGESPIFPNLVFRVKEGVNLNEGDPNYDLFKLAIKVASHRMNPTFSFMDSSFNKKYGDEISYMGCRTRTIQNRNGLEISAGRGNIAPVTINLPRLALKAGYGNIDGFFEEFDNILELCKEQLLHRFNILAKLRVKDLPFLMGQKLYMGSENLKDDDEILEAIKNGTLGIGFIGLAETLIALIGKHHGEDEEALELGLRIIKHLRDYCDRTSEETGLNFVAYATPAEGTSGRFVPKDREKYGLIKGVTDKDYYTNSYHIPVYYEISMFEKIRIEGKFHSLCNGGHISYVELPSTFEHNLDAFEKIIKWMKECDIGYAGVNFPIDECRICGYRGVINEDECPVCQGSDIRRIRRITGYLSTTDRFNDAKLKELEMRVKHI
ncbi:anaerobic ribonucleoside-triphosphate reductase [Caloramator proteoclasticus]|uniref:Ribonucleoside-triphosphate reductase class III catalytic subunit n=1 Tax=Caloramator proteoclasticus DSM 10124 TaxID=1121262 RepID=A0A1M4UEN5_9CLOT|nr:anaerobic ribonucleoside-triphosphate reductase [Caloramator proteoclasticus]SHE55232.1 ribonucleoside-triphosphate reductase class III catalytic subunit [Caloramator proteoclasticus DSM 10124]